VGLKNKISEKEPFTLISKASGKEKFAKSNIKFSAKKINSNFK
jgi:hypothetical protein